MIAPLRLETDALQALKMKPPSSASAQVFARFSHKLKIWFQNALLLNRYRIVASLIIIAAFSGLKAFAVDPVVTVRFSNPVFICSTQTYKLDVEFQCDTPNKQLFGMNVRFFYPDNVLEFQSFGEFTSNYSAVSPNPPIISTGNATSGMTNFGFPGPQEYVNGAIQKTSNNIITYLSTTGWTKIFCVNFHVDDPNALASDSFCPPVIWDLNEAQTGGINPSGGIVITLVLTYPNGTTPTTEHCVQFNWQYDGVPGLPHGTPNPTQCINTICSYAPHSILPTYGSANPGSITVPVKVTNFNNIGALHLVFEYDSAAMSYVSQTPNAIFNETNGSLTVNDSASTGGMKKITMNFDGNFISLSDSSHLTDLLFNYASGSTDLTWNTTGNNCSYIGQYNVPAYDTPPETYYINGLVANSNAPVTKIDTAVAYSGDYVTFSVRVWNYFSIHSGMLTLNYDPVVLSFSEAVENNAISTAFAIDSSVPGTLELEWVGQDTTLADGSVLAYLTFQYLGGAASLNWFNNGLSCQYVNCGEQIVLNDEPTTLYYFNGQISNAVTVWTGDNSGDWGSDGNWDDNTTPNAAVDVIIDPSANPENWPVFNGNFTLGEDCNNLTLNNNAHLTILGDFTISPGRTLNLNGSGILEISGDWINSGNFLPGQGIVEFNGTENAVINEGVPPENFIAGYVRSTFSAGMTPLTGGTAGPAGDNAHLDVNIGFDFNYLGVNYTQTRINTNGWLSLDLSGDDISSPDNMQLFISNAPFTTLAPWWDDLLDDATSVISYKTEGTAPSRVFTAEWKNILAYSSVATARLNFQVKLYETSGIIEFCYGNVVSGIHNSDESASIGAKDGTGGTGNFKEATLNTNTISVSYLNSNTDWPQENYRFTPPVPAELESFHKLVVTKTGSTLFIQRDVEVTGLD